MKKAAIIVNGRRENFGEISKIIGTVSAAVSARPEIWIVGDDSGDELCPAGLC